MSGQALLLQPHILLRHCAIAHHLPRHKMTPFVMQSRVMGKKVQESAAGIPAMVAESAGA